VTNKLFLGEGIYFFLRTRFFFTKNRLILFCSNLFKKFSLEIAVSDYLFFTSFILHHKIWRHFVFALKHCCFNMIAVTVKRNIQIKWFIAIKGCRGRDRMVVGFTTTYAISAYHDCCCESESRIGQVVQHYVIKLVRDLRQICCFHRVLRFPPPIKLTATIYLKYCWKWRLTTITHSLQW